MLQPIKQLWHQQRNFAQGNTGWTTSGNVVFTGEVATLSESGTDRSSLRQAFFIPANASILRLAITQHQIGTSLNRTPDAFEIALLNPLTFAPISWNDFRQPVVDALLNIQSDGTYTKSSKVRVGRRHIEQPIGRSGRSRNHGALIVQIDVSGIPVGTLAVLSFDLLGFAQVNSFVTVDNIFITSEALRNPVAETDLIETDEDKAVTINILANDRDNESALDPASIVIQTAPRNGVLTVDAVAGTVRYTPNADYSGSDSFIYTVRDVDGYLSNQAFVSIQVRPVTDNPKLTTKPVQGDQDVALPLVIDAATTDRDGSETLSIVVDQLPMGATLSKGTQTAAASIYCRQVTW